VIEIDLLGLTTSRGNFLQKKIISAGAIIASINFFMFYAIFSWEVPYSPDGFVMINMQYFIALILFIVYILIIFLYKKNGTDAPRYKFLFSNINRSALLTRVFVFLILSPSIFLMMIGVAAQRWPSYPTKYFADEAFSENVSCTLVEPLGKYKRYAMINAVDSRNNKFYEFPWPTRLAPVCPKDINITGRRWAFGSYIETLN